MKKRTIALLMAVVMLFGATVGGTLAWLTAKTAPVVNTFTVGDINIELKEHNYNPETKQLTDVEVTSESDYKIIPGTDLPKDPFVRVKKGSEACYVFVKVEETNWPTAKVTYAIDTTVWKVLDAVGVTGVYYKEVSSLVGATEDLELNILADKEVVVSDTLTKEEAVAIKNAGNPTLTFTAYAVQLENVDDEVEAWTIAIANS